LALTLRNRAIRLFNDHQFEPALAAAKESVEQYRIVFQQNPTDGMRFALSNAFFTLMLNELKNRHPAAAADAVQRRLDLWPKDAGAAYEAARDMARVAQAFLDMPGDQAEADRHADQAIEYLREALARGYKDAAALQKEKAFDILRSREDYKELQKKF